jgi:hypothetical protein
MFMINRVEKNKHRSEHIWCCEVVVWDVFLLANQCTAGFDREEAAGFE